MRNMKSGENSAKGKWGADGTFSEEQEESQGDTVYVLTAHNHLLGRSK